MGDTFKRPDADAIERARVALERVQETWLSHPGVRGAYVGLLRDSDGSVTNELGIVILIDPDDERAAGALPDRLDDFPVQVLRSSPGLEA